MGFLGSLEKMTITAYANDKFTKQVGDELAVYLNPEKYSHSMSICYNDVQAQGSSGPTPDFDKMASEEVEFELVFDGTGVVPSPIPGVVPFTGDGITKQIDQFKKLVFNYDKNIHSPRYLKLAWGTLLFKCRLFRLNVNYTLFKPDGTPLRARANVTFVEYDEGKALNPKKSSPDLSHVLTVKGGDTLPLLCDGVYGRSSCYLEVARVNGLTDFRHLEVGSRLLFPPLAEAPS